MSLGAAVYAALVTALFSLSALAMGAAIVRHLGAGEYMIREAQLGADDAPAIAATAFLVGLGGMGGLLTILGLWGLLRPVAVWALVAAGLALVPGSGPLLRGCFAELRAMVRLLRGESIAVRLLFLAGVLTFAAFALAALVRPPIGDAEAFYLAYAKVMAVSGRLAPMPGTYEQFSSIGLPLELHMAALFAIAGPGAAKLVVWPVALCVVVLLASIVAVCGGGWIARRVSALILLTSSTFTHYIWDGKVDLAAAAFGVAACYWMLSSKEDRSLARMLLVGFLAGAATVAKFSYVVSLGCSLTVLLAWRWRHGSAHPEPRRLVRMVVAASLAAVVAWLPQLLKNSVLFSAPLAPFLGSPWDSNWLNQVWFSPEVTRHILAIYPFALVFGRYPMQGGGLSFLMLAFFPFVLTYGRLTSGAFRRELGVVTLAALAGTVAWMILRPSVIAPRYILATLLLFLPAIALITEKAWCTAVTPRVIRVGIVMTSAIALAGASWHVLPVLGSIKGLRADGWPACFLASPYCEPLRQVNSLAMPGDRLYLASYYGYWLRSDLLQCRDTRDEVKPAADEALVESLSRRGFRFAVVEPSVQPEVYSRLADSAARRILHADSVSVFELPVAEWVGTVCVEIAQGDWEVHVQEPAR